MLTSYSAHALAALQKLLPDLVELATEQEDDFIIQTKALSGWELWISSADDELTVGFDEYHTHFGWHKGSSQHDATDVAAFVAELRNGQVELAAWYEGEEYAGSSMLQVGEEVKPPTGLQEWWRRKQRLEIRRWMPKSPFPHKSWDFCCFKLSLYFAHAYLKLWLLPDAQQILRLTTSYSVPLVACEL
jgi:hypothetical protein